MIYSTANQMEILVKKKYITSRAKSKLYNNLNLENKAFQISLSLI